ncbi:ATP dependent DNA ligase [Epithele typhae]|uniref:ATP dependent DNA ligase n=1 Tax=Epithele typhae TaxID=378194 RepID=UPI002008C017|nr:ATP dependent DNA ligase [Epithele typhae]KAH9910490.1 ATP dependent DNA ligase [Epithele typhae]
MSLTFQRGFLALTGPRIDTLAQKAIADLEHTTYAEHGGALHDSQFSGFHITVCTKDELREGSIKAALPSLDSVDTQHLYVVGLAGNPKLGVFYLVVIWAPGQSLRKRVGLKPKQFHITLSKHDDHTLNKGFDAVLPRNYCSSLSWTNTDFLDHLAFTLHAEGNFTRAREIGSKLVNVDPQSERGFLRLADAAIKEGQFKLAMLGYACAYDRCSGPKAPEYCLQKLEDCAQYTEWGCLVMDDERRQIERDTPRELLAPWSQRVRDAVASRGSLNASSLCIPSREHMLVPHPSRPFPELFRLPRFFRWLIPFHIALMSTPRGGDDIEVLAAAHLAIRHVVTLTDEMPLDRSWFARRNVQNTFLPVPDYRPPTIEQMDLILRLLEDRKNTPILIHCAGGKGRAGTVAACYLVAYGFALPDSSRTEPAMTAKQAIAALRVMRPGSLESEVQEDFVAKYCSAIWKRHAILPDLVPEPPPCPLEIEGTLPRDADLFVLVGLPGSGKSTFVRALLARDPRGWTHISQDESGSRAACERAIGHAAHGRVLLDLCNVARARRADWLALAASWARAPVCVFFDYPRTLCESRAQNRAGHPTLPPGGRVRAALAQMHGQLERPQTAEGFGAVCVVRSFAAADELVARLSPPVGLFKFPRTPHLLDLGAATSDDVVISRSPLPSVDASPAPDTHVVVTEKVDGANMGFSLSADRASVVVQNRSHFVNPTSHAQFRALGAWLARHDEALRRVLGRDALFAQRFVLFGEWLAATHSIAYSRLPGLFVAFDLYDRSAERWADRRTLEGLLAGTGIPLVPLVHEGRMLEEEELRRAVERPSLFYDGPVEGVYVKVERDGWVVSRGKVVRADFITGNEHWSKGPLQLNTLCIEDSE